jgi:acyl-CoA synthetase (AMP-forming)/AMP-acid ligase II
MKKLSKTTLLLLLGSAGLLSIAGVSVGFAAWTYVNPSNVAAANAGGVAKATSVVSNTSTVSGSISVSGNAVVIIDDTGYTTATDGTKTYTAVAFWADAKQDYSTDSSKIVAPTMAATLALTDTTAVVPSGTAFTYAIAISKTDSTLGYLLDYVDDFSASSLTWASGVSIASSLPTLTIKTAAVPQNLTQYDTMIEALDNTVITFTFSVKGPTA